MGKWVGPSLGLLLFLSAAAALSEESDVAETKAPMKKMMDHGAMGHEGMQMGPKGMKMGKSGMGHPQGVDDMQASMQALYDHSKMMEGMTDQADLSLEMKKHMRMMDEMMAHMMRRQAEAAVASDAAPGPTP